MTGTPRATRDSRLCSFTLNSYRPVLKSIESLRPNEKSITRVLLNTVYGRGCCSNCSRWGTASHAELSWIAFPEPAVMHSSSNNRKRVYFDMLRTYVCPCARSAVYLAVRQNGTIHTARKRDRGASTMTKISCHTQPTTEANNYRGPDKLACSDATT